MTGGREQSGEKNNFDRYLDEQLFAVVLTKCPSVRKGSYNLLITYLQISRVAINGFDN